VVGILDLSGHGGAGPGTLYLPLPWMIAVTDPAQPNGVRYPPQPNQPAGQPRPPSGPGTVVGGWSRVGAAKYIEDQGGYQSLLVNVDSTDHVGTVAKTINKMGLNTATGLAALDKQKKNANVVAAILGGLGLVALGIAALGVMNTMVMSVLERTREIGVMRAVGARAKTIRRLFSLEAAALGFFGGLFGVVIGYVFVLAAKPVISDAVKSGPVKNANFAVPLWLVLVVVGGTTLIGFASGFLPARRAARLDPVESLRYE
jgi:ABC-type antimicrobial peptide transport system permease subunit